MIKLIKAKEMQTALFIRKPYNIKELYDTSKADKDLYEISETINLSKDDYQDLISNFLEDNEILSGKGGFAGKDIRKVVKISCPGEKSLLIDPQGSSYARYVAFEPESTDSFEKASKKIKSAVDENSSLEEIEKEIEKLKLLQLKKQEEAKRNNNPESENLKNEKSVEEEKINNSYLYQYKDTGSITAFIKESWESVYGQTESGKEVEIPLDMIYEEIFGPQWDQNIGDQLDTDSLDQEEVKSALAEHDNEFLEYLPEILKSSVIAIKLQDLIITGYESKPHITYNIYTNKILSDEEANELRAYMSGQLSDGIGEGFEQQDFETSMHFNKWDISSFTVKNEDYNPNAYSDYEGEDGEESEDGEGFEEEEEYFEVSPENDIDVEIAYSVSPWSGHPKMEFKGKVNGVK